LSAAIAIAVPLAVSPMASGDDGKGAVEGLTSHRAVYRIALVRAEQQDGMRGADGTLTYTQINRCTGYTIESRLEADFGFANGLTNVIRQVYAGLESRDGTASSFRMQVFENDMLEDSYRGHVAIESGGAGRADYEGNRPAAYRLPPGTLLATTQTAALIAAARSGERFVSHIVMDGIFPDGPYRVAGVIGNPRPIRPGATGDIQWPVTLAYFPLEGAAETPTYETRLDLAPGGIVRRMVQDFGAHTLAFEPESITAIEGPSC
jgi:hypothetical protein